jgi:two-component system, LuxR family, response regulator FixJ
MTNTETIILAMSDPARRIQCFQLLDGGTQRIVRGFSCAADAREALGDTRAGCLIVDASGLASDAVIALLRTAGSHPALWVIMLADRLDHDMMQALAYAGPCTILPAAAPAADIAAVAAKAAPQAARIGQQWQESSTAIATLARLSPRENDVLAALAAGHTSKDIARQLRVSPRTVEVHRASIMRRTGAASLAALLRLHFLAEQSRAGQPVQGWLRAA